MLSENLKNLRKARGMSQEGLADRLNVVRQTISKWEKGLSVPDSEMLIRLAEVLDTSVTVLLGETIDLHSTEEECGELRAIAARLEQLNEQFARRNEQRRIIVRVLLAVICLISTGIVLSSAAVYVHTRMMNDFMGNAESSYTYSVIGGADGPTSILLVSMTPQVISIAVAAAAAVFSAVGFCKMKKKG